MPQIEFKTNTIIEIDMSNRAIEVTPEPPKLIDLEVTPTTEKQTFKHIGNDGYDEVIVNAVTSAIDENIQPTNIKSGVEILGVVGELNEGYSIEIEEDTLVFSNGISVKDGELII